MNYGHSSFIIFLITSEPEQVIHFHNPCVVERPHIVLFVPKLVIGNIDVAADLRYVVDTEVHVGFTCVVVPLDEGAGGQPRR